MSGAGGVVVLLFTDLVGSTELLTRLGDDAADQVREEHFRLLRRAIDAADGREVKTLGDGVMAAFTSPMLALACALEIQETVAEQSGRSSSPLRVRVGLHAGEPVETDEDFHGTAVVVAKRLCDAAEGGQIVASQLVRELIGSRGEFAFRSLGRLDLKGLADPVGAVTVQRRPTSSEPGPGGRAPRRPTVPPAPRLPLVGRDGSLAVLEEELQRAAGGELRAVLLLGEPGVGKTRLAGELLARHGDTTIGLTARAHSFGATTPFGVWAEALERYLRGLEPEEVERLCAGFLDDLAQLLRSVAAVRGRGPVGEPPRSRLLEGLAVVLANLAADHPLTVVIDDIHLADPSSLEALRYVSFSCPDSRLLVVATARPGELADQPVAGDVLGALEQDGTLRRLALRPLLAEDLADLAAAVVGEAVPDALVGWLDGRSLGNPLYALGLLRGLLDEGADLSRPELTRLPEPLSDRVTSRLRQLDEDALNLLELLAVVERRVELRSLVALSGEGPDAVSKILAQLVRTRLVLEEERGLELVFELAHPLIQESIYQRIGAVRRRTLHRQVGRGLLSADRLAEAAPHFVRSADPGDAEAVKVLRDALAQAEQRDAYAEALTILGSMVELLPRGDPRWIDVVDSLSPDAQWVSEHRAERHSLLGIPALVAMDEALEDLDDPARRARVKLRLATLLSWGAGRIEEAEVFGRAAFDLFRQVPDRRGEILASQELAWLAAGKDPQKGLAAAIKDVEAARTEADDRVLARTLRTVGQMQLFFGDIDEAVSTMEEAADVVRRLDDAHALTMCQGWTAVCLATAGRAHEARTMVTDARRVNPRWSETQLPYYEIMTLWTAGDYGSTVERAREAVASQSAIGRVRYFSFVVAALACLEMGRPADAESFLGRARQTHQARLVTKGPDDLAPTGPLPMVAPAAAVQLVEARLAFQRGAHQEATRLLHLAVTELIKRGEGITFPSFLMTPELVEQPALAASVATVLEVRAREYGGEMQWGLAHFARAVAAEAYGDLDTASGEAEEAVGRLSGVEAKGYLAAALEVLGRSCVTQDRARSVEALDRAAATFDACAAAARRERVVQLLQSLGASGQRAAAAFGPGSLTARERDVARLAAQGYPARQIADELFIGVRTVEGHLARSYAKLGVTSKIELVRRAVEFGLD